MTEYIEQYTLGYGRAATLMMASRSAERHAAFLLPHLKPGMRILDCGCGPGSITLGLAEIVAPGEAVGTDIEESQLDLGRAAATQRNIANVSFQRANAYELPFADESFDAVFISAMLGNTRDPSRALTEARRVLKDGAVIGIKEFDHGGDLLYPPQPDLIEGQELYYRLRRHNGHDPEGGRKVMGLVLQAGFRNAAVKASYETFSGPDVLPRFGAASAGLVAEGFAPQLERLGWITPEGVQRIVRAWQDFAKSPEAFYALAWCEVLAWK